MLTPAHVIAGLGVMLLLAGVVGFVRERRRLSNIVAVIFGAALTFLGFIVVTQDDGNGAALWVVVVLSILVIGPFLAYPVLTVFLLVNGLMMVRRESRSLGNLLSLFAGLAMVALPMVVIAVGGLAVDDARWDNVLTSITTYVLGLALYIAFCFFVFLCAAFAYRKIPTTTRADYVVVLGSGLMGAKVPPLLASRLDKGAEVADAQEPPATIIVSGGKGPDEEVSEAEAMAAYLRDHGVSSSRIILEDRSRNTRENLIFSRELLPSPDTPILVTTNQYHVFRTALLTRELGIDAVVVGSKTARYYVPSAFLREFAAVMKEYLVVNAVLVGAWTLMVLAWALIDLLA